MKNQLESARLKFRPCAQEDLDLLLRHWTQPLVRRYLFDDRIADRPTVKTFIRQSAGNFTELGFGLWLLTDKVDGGFHGVCGFTEKDGSPDLLFSIEPEHWGQGLATESATSVMAYAFKALNVSQIVATVDKPNTMSIRILEKLGMRLQAEELIQGHPILFYVITKEDYRAPNDENNS
jgi:RimJ/RimL family protein N-acetyltransferase